MEGNRRASPWLRAAPLAAALAAWSGPAAAADPGPETALRFVEIGAAAGLPQEGMPPGTQQEQLFGRGLAAADYDGDGDIDLFVPNNGARPNELFRNRGDGSFEEVGAAAGVPTGGEAGAAAFGDIDGDGDLDLFVGGLSGTPPLLLRNEGGAFVDATAGSGLEGFRRYTMSAAFADDDRDGDLDLFLSHWSQDPTGDDTQTLWRNRGDGVFESRGVAAGLSGPINAARAVTLDGIGETDLASGANFDFTFTPILSDLDGDGDLDLAMAADFGTSQVFRNDGAGGFERATDRAAIDDEFGMGAAVADYDNDGDMDWFVTSVLAPDPAVAAKVDFPLTLGTGNRLYRNDGKGGFEDVAAEAGVVDGGWAWGACFADFDNDGHLDIFHVNGYHDEAFAGAASRFFHANGDGTFTERAAELGLADTGQGRGAVCFDADRDGDIDIAVAHSVVDPGQPPVGRPLLYYRNELSGPNRGLTVRLRSATGNTAGVGARVEVRSAAGVQVREVHASGGFASQNPIEAHFGMGRAETADIEVRWPDGAVEARTGVAAGGLVEIGQTAFGLPRLAVDGGSGGGAYRPGARVRIEAPARIGDRHFSHWEGAGGRFDDPRARSAAVVMPDRAATVRARYVAGTPMSADVGVARRWIETLLQAIRQDFARPTVHARNLFHLSAAMYDAWAAYGGGAAPWLLGRSRAGVACPFERGAAPADIAAARREAMSHAAHRLVRWRFRRSPGAAWTRENAEALMGALGYDIAGAPPEPARARPAALGAHIAACYIALGLADGANEAEDYASRDYAPANSPLPMGEPGNPYIDDLDRWQPLRLASFVDQSGHAIPGETEFIGPEWGRVLPFALSARDAAVHRRGGTGWTVYLDPGPPPRAGDPDGRYMRGFALVARWSSHLDPGDGVEIDISPGAIGAIRAYPDGPAGYEAFYDAGGGGDPGRGHALNPATGEPYAPQVVPRGDYARVLAEFWADGPESETPPGHWFVILNEVADHPLLERRLAGAGPELDRLEWEAKAYFALGGAMHDAAVAAWSVKGRYDYIRPVSVLRAMGGPRWRGKGLETPLVEGFVERVAEGDPLAGANGENAGEIKLYAWRGPDRADPATGRAGVGWILARDWWPYQRPDFVTPPFAGYVSGHSTFSRAAAEVLEAFTGDPFFPGGKSGFRIPADTFLEFERGPTVDMTLEWATYRDAADQCALSRIWGGIHPPADDIPGRRMGAAIGKAAYALALAHFEGRAENP